MSLQGRLMAAVDAWKAYGAEPVIATDGRYSRLYSWWDGTWTHDLRMVKQRGAQPVLYRNTRQVWRQARAIVNLYAQFVYSGALSRDGQPLPDGSRGAIPIDPLTGQKTSDEALLRAISELFTIWNWDQHMTFRPKMGAILGDYLTELVDDRARGVVLPEPVWPGYVVDLELDLVGNVKRYAIEREVIVSASTAFGMPVKAERYRFRKEVDREMFRFYRDGKPSAFPEDGILESEEGNPYGFVPAIWDRHELVPGQHGLSAIETTLNQTLELNGILSHALDYQQKQFAAPVGVKGSTTLGRTGRTITMPGGVNITASTAEDDLAAARQAAAENLNLIPLSENGDFVTVNFDVGKTTEMLGLVMDSILAENPEARYGQEILQMTQVTGPGMERALGPIAGLVRAARSNYDPNTVKKLQMAIAMTGFRLNEDNYDQRIVAARKDRYEAFRPYDLTSYGAGLLDFAIPDRPVFASTPEERLANLEAMGRVIDTGDPWLMAEAGVPEAEIRRIVGEQDARRKEMAAAFSVAGAGEGDEDEGATGPRAQRGRAGPADHQG